ncbi:MAG TPA: phosphoglycerate dehydrogenase, partial [Ktedonobacterales bacterium]
MNSQSSGRILKPRVLVADPIAREGLDHLRGFAEVDERHGLAAETLREIIGGYDALVVRSETKVTAAIIEAGSRLRVIARAGVGVDNIDVETATRRGVIVVNSPLGNIGAAAEHTVALLLAMARHIAPANASLRAGKWERAAYVGTEIRGKTLGIVGLGKVGSEVARRCGEGGLGMRLIGVDPYASPDTARALGVQLMALDELLPQADFITIHTALTTGTRGLIGADELARMKPSIRLINCARGGIVEEAALLAALEAGQIAGVALDVLSKEPPGDEPTLKALIAHPRVLVTPHLGASTEEAQVSVALDVAEQIGEITRGGSAHAAVNAPMILPETLRQLRPWMTLVERLGRMHVQLHPAPLRRVELSISGEITQHDTRALVAALIKGLLESVSDAHVNLVNAPVLAREWGLEVVESRSSTAEPYTSLVTLRVADNGTTHEFAGTVIWGAGRVVRVDRFATDFEPHGHLLFARNLDIPGMIGKVGVLLGEAGVNIGHMDVGPVTMPGEAKQRSTGNEALMVLSLDNAAPAEAIERMRASEGIFDVSSMLL